MSDTDSFCLSVIKKQQNDESVPLDEIADVIDFSNYPKNSIQYDNSNANKLGFFKDELCGNRMLEFVGLRSKTYAFLLKEGECATKVLKSKCKGVSRGYKKNIKFDSFKKCLKTITKKSVVQYNIRAKNHVIHTQRIKKICFTSFDDKRYIMDCAIHSVPYGSKFIKKSIRTGLCPFC
jgi:hypothetical protein